MILDACGKPIHGNTLMFPAWLLAEERAIAEQQRVSFVLRDLRASILGVDAAPRIGNTITVRLPKRYQP